MINDSNSYDYLKKELKEEDVLYLNSKINEKSHETIFANSSDLIQMVRKYKP